ncbi:hypothetical protein ACJMK2_042572 [Sinanodonta woodiana]|uniref:SMB domain-containing protein n=1 Tax=Sinanodonta woodiana TaxID=1069815 RepID=A0ABD3W7U9_SINWO
MAYTANDSIFTLLILWVIFSMTNSSENTLPERGVLKRHKRYIEMGPDIVGRPFCETHPIGCCPGRRDNCSVPILGSLCYCDIFCNSTADDCCPDFESFCLGRKPNTPSPFRIGCQDEAGRPYRPDSVIQVNCNKCTCSPDTRNPGRHRWLCGKEVCLIRDDIIKNVNDGNYGWRASNYSFLWGMTLQDGIRYRLGTLGTDETVLRMTPINVRKNSPLPRSFDARQKWPGLVHSAKDQGNCGSSWALSTTALLADRLSIQSRGEIMEELSPQHIISCDNNGGNGGCDGGYLDRAWWFLRKKGVVTEECYPYRSGQTDRSGVCMLSSHQNSGTCPSGIYFHKDKVFQSTPPYRIAAREEDIMNEIIINGPVQASFKAKEDFFMYNAGVYQHVNHGEDNMPNNRKREYHSVRIIGWGVDGTSGLKYWLCANSWGPDWGESGYFRIVRGNNECQIESFVIGVWGKVNDVQLSKLLESFRLERRRERYRLDDENGLRRRRHIKHKLQKNKHLQTSNNK